MSTLSYFETTSGGTVVMDPSYILSLLNALALRVTQSGDIEAFLVTEDGPGWVDLTDCQFHSIPAADVVVH